MLVFVIFSSPSAFGHFARLLSVREAQRLGVHFTSTPMAPATPKIHYDADFAPAWICVMLLFAALLYLIIGERLRGEHGTGNDASGMRV